MILLLYYKNLSLLMTLIRLMEKEERRQIQM